MDETAARPATPIPDGPGPDAPEAERRRRARVLTAPQALEGLLDGSLTDFVFDDETVERLMSVQVGVAHATAMDCLRHTTAAADDAAGRAAELSGAIRLMTVGIRLVDGRARRKAGGGRTCAGAPGPGIDTGAPGSWTDPVPVMWENGPATGGEGPGDARRRRDS